MWPIPQHLPLTNLVCTIFRILDKSLFPPLSLSTFSAPLTCRALAWLRICPSCCLPEDPYSNVCNVWARLGDNPGLNMHDGDRLFQKKGYHSFGTGYSSQGNRKFHQMVGSSLSSVEAKVTFSATKYTIALHAHPWKWKTAAEAWTDSAISQGCSSRLAPRR